MQKKKTTGKHNGRTQRQFNWVSESWQSPHWWCSAQPTHCLLRPSATTGPTGSTTCTVLLPFVAHLLTRCCSQQPVQLGGLHRPPADRCSSWQPICHYDKHNTSINPYIGSLAEWARLEKTTALSHKAADAGRSGWCFLLYNIEGSDQSLDVLSHERSAMVPVQHKGGRGRGGGEEEEREGGLSLWTQPATGGSQSKHTLSQIDLNQRFSTAGSQSKSGS